MRNATTANRKKKFRLIKPLHKPRDYKTPKYLLEFVVNRLVVQDVYENYYTHNQMARIVFGSGDIINMGYLSIVTANYSNYQERLENKYRWNIKSLYNDFPEFFGEGDRPLGKLDELLLAVQDEKEAVRRNRQKNLYHINELKEERVPKVEHVYSALLQLELDDQPRLVEEMPIQVEIGKKRFPAKVVDYDPLKSQVIFQSDKTLSSFPGRERIVVSAGWLLDKLQERLIEVVRNGNPVWKFIDGQCTPANIEEAGDIYYGSLDESQREAVKRAITHDITMIWGPPGTGKSFTLSHLLLNAYLRQEKTLVCCIANVAIDKLTNDFVKLFDQYNSTKRVKHTKGDALRIGFTRDRKLLENDFLFPNSPKIKKIRREIERLSRKIDRGNFPEKKVIEFKARRTQLKENLDTEMKAVVQAANLVFTTAAKVHADPTLHQLDFENLVVDEASMMSVPHFVALAKSVGKRIIIAGDFRQLGPVVQSQTSRADKWLKKDIFEFSGLDVQADQLEHPALVQIDRQRRMHEQICELINSPFYMGKLISVNTSAHSKLKAHLPFENRIIAYQDLSGDPDYRCERTRKGSRYNEASAYAIIKLLEKLIHHPLGEISVGIVTPYRGQVNLLNRQIQKRDWPAVFKQQIKIGTIHAFQGSEADLIIWDIVDDVTQKVGRLYQLDSGRRMINVAISRAKYKLVVVGDLNVFLRGVGHNNINGAVLRISNDLRRYKIR